MFDSVIFEKARCSKEERLSCLPTIEYLLSLHKMKQKTGYASLEAEIAENKNTMLSKGLLFIVDGASPEIFKKTMMNYVYASNCIDKNLLEKIIIVDGITFLHNDHGYSRFMADILISHLG